MITYVGNKMTAITWVGVAMTKVTWNAYTVVYQK